MVFYRKYRPQIIEELDSLDIREKLYSVLSDKTSVPHAFLFTGPKGLGKTSTARIVAKAINCQKHLAINKEQKTKNKDQKSENIKSSKLKVESVEDIEPCNKCTQCTSITNGTNMDVLEIDAASNRGIDEIRDLRDKIRLAPISASKKVYIIDEVHMLTAEAFNALLKTLEEPPAHAIFILCTTEVHKLPETIISRCFHIAFRKATDEELFRSFKRIVKCENLEIEDGALKFVASLSDGSFRDGVKVLEELALLSNGKKITKELIEKKFQISNIQFQISNMLGFLAEKSTKEALVLVSKIVGQGVDIKYFIEQLINQLHEELLIKVGIEAAGPVSSQPQAFPARLTRRGPPLGAPRSEPPALDERCFSLEDIKNLIELLSKAHGELKYAVLPQLPLELMIIEWTQQTLMNAELNADERGADSSSSKSFLKKKDEVMLGVGKQSEKLDQRESASRSADISDNIELWKKLIDMVKQQNHSIAGVLRGCSLKNFDKKNLIIEAGYKFHKEKLEERKTLEIIEKAVEELVGKSISVSVVLKEK